MNEIESKNIARQRLVSARTSTLTLTLKSKFMLMLTFTIMMTMVLTLSLIQLQAGNAAAVAVGSATEVRIHYLDVGQADSILIQSGKENMLIDAGNKDDDRFVVDYLKRAGVKQLAYVVGTHPHEDHIGGLAAVVQEFKVAAVIMPKITTNTKTFENLLTVIQSKGLKITTPVAGKSFKLGKAEFTVLAPNRVKYDDLNNYSVVLRMVYGKTSFLFQGDAERIVEQEILKKGDPIHADVIKLGHHGSDSSSSAAYLNKVKPSYAIISCGLDNDYGHPNNQVLKRLEDNGIKYFRTDQNGTIVCATNGARITFKTTNGAAPKASTPTTTKPGAQAVDKTLGAKASTASEKTQQKVAVYVTKSGKKYHLDGCSVLSKSKIRMTLDAAKATGYKPCSICKPPQ